MNNQRRPELICADQLAGKTEVAIAHLQRWRTRLISWQLTAQRPGFKNTLLFIPNGKWNKSRAASQFYKPQAHCIATGKVYPADVSVCAAIYKQQGKDERHQGGLTTDFLPALHWCSLHLPSAPLLLAALQITVCANSIQVHKSAHLHL